MWKKVLLAVAVAASLAWHWSKWADAGFPAVWFAVAALWLQVLWTDVKLESVIKRADAELKSKQAQIERLMLVLADTRRSVAELQRRPGDTAD